MLPLPLPAGAEAEQLFPGHECAIDQRASIGTTWLGNSGALYFFHRSLFPLAMMMTDEPTNELI
jgi:hypothetical protein